MGLWEMIVAVVALGVAAQIITAYFKSKEQGSASSEGISEQISRIDTLEKRIEVLERIATDKRNNLKEEIDNL